MFNFIIPPTEVEIRTNYVGYMAIAIGSYTIKVKGQEIIDASFTSIVIVSKNQTA